MPSGRDRPASTAAQDSGDHDPIPMLMMNLVRAVYWYDEALQDALRRAGWPSVTRMQSLLFANIANGVTRPARLAHNLGMTRQSMGQMIDELVRREILRVTPDPADRRAQIVGFSPEGRALTRAARATMRAIEQELASRLGTPDLEKLRDLLARNWGDPPTISAPTNESEATAIR